MLFTFYHSKNKQHTGMFVCALKAQNIQIIYYIIGYGTLVEKCHILVPDTLPKREKSMGEHQSV